MKEAPLNRFQCRQNSSLLEEDAMRDLHSRRGSVSSGVQASKDRLTFWRGANAAGDFQLKPSKVDAHLPSKRIRLNLFSLCSVSGTIKSG